MNIRTLSLSFDLPLAHRQIPQWRGAFAELAGVENDLFHNHKNQLAFSINHLPSTEEEDNLIHDTENRTDVEGTTENGQWEMVNGKYHYRYPLIQYRAQKGTASIFALNEGIEAVQGVLSSRSWQINWEGAPRPLLITGMQMQEYDLRLLPRPKAYQLYRWLALNGDNYARWQQCDGLLERVALLERILASQILAFAGSVGWRVPERLEVRLQNLGATQQVYCHGTPLLAFDVSYTANVLLPPHIALGKGVSHGFGWQVPQSVQSKPQPRTPGLVQRSATL